MSAESEAVVAAIKAMSDSFLGRIVKTESDFVEHTRRVENQMAQLIDLTKHMAVMHAKNDGIHEDLSEIKATLRINQEKVETSITRLHKRIDEVSEDSRDHSDTTKRHADIQVKVVSDKLEIQVKVVSDKLELLDKAYSAFVNRIDGAKRFATTLWILFAFIVSTFGFLGKNWIENIDREKQEQAVSIKRLEITHRELEDILKQKVK